MRKALIALLVFCSFGVAQPRIHGFFIQPGLSYGGIDYDATTFGTQQHFDDWVQSMADVGAKYLIYQWSARYESGQTWYSSAYPGTPSNGDFAYYDIAQDSINGIPTQSWSAPTSWPGKDTSALERTLIACGRAGMKLFFGLYLNEASASYNWWDAINDATISSADSLTIEHHVARSLSMIDDIANQYGSHPAFEGFYYTIEVANVAFIPQENHPYLASILDRVADRAHEQAPGSRICLSPFFNTQLASAADFGTMWEYALANSDFDLVILQDGVGVDPFALTDQADAVSPYYAALKTAAVNAGKSFWANSELFTQDVGGDRMNPLLIPSNIEKLKLQFAAEGAYVDTFVCFGFHYMDPNPLHTFSAGHMGGLANEAQLRKEWYDEYKNYYDTLTVVPVSEPTQKMSSVDFAMCQQGRNISFQFAKPNASYRIVSASGRIVSQGSVVAGEALSLKSLSQGVYLYEVLLNDVKKSGSFLVR